MGYRELHRMEIEEVVRRWQVGEPAGDRSRQWGGARDGQEVPARRRGLGLAPLVRHRRRTEVVRLVKSVEW